MTGVSGSGKSTLVNEVLYKSLANRLHRARQRPGAHRGVKGLDQLDKIIQVDQSPIGRTPRSNPATYTGLFDVIRDLFAKTQEARARGYKPGRFSFNVKGGRCEVCRGDGQIKIEMHFLPDIYVPCEQCHGKRYNRETLQVRFKGKTIADVLEMPVEEALEFFQHIPKIRRRLETLNDVGLGYIRLGQPATTLSGGEAQRVKLATELSKIATGRTLYILDEPTTGLHFADVERLLDVLHRLDEQGNSRRRHRAQPRRHQDRRPDHRHGPGGRRRGRHGRRDRHARGGRRRRPGSYTGQFLGWSPKARRRTSPGRPAPTRASSWPSSSRPPHRARRAGAPARRAPTAAAGARRRPRPPDALLERVDVQRLDADRLIAGSVSASIAGPLPLSWQRSRTVVVCVSETWPMTVAEPLTSAPLTGSASPRLKPPSGTGRSARCRAGWRTRRSPCPR